MPFRFEISFQYRIVTMAGMWSREDDMLSQVRVGLYPAALWAVAQGQKQASPRMLGRETPASRIDSIHLQSAARLVAKGLSCCFSEGWSCLRCPRALSPARTTIQIADRDAAQAATLNSRPAIQKAGSKRLGLERHPSSLRHWGPPKCSTPRPSRDLVLHIAATRVSDLTALEHRNR